MSAAGAAPLLRAYAPADAEGLAALYRASVLGLGPAAYTGAETRAWAAWADDREAVAARLALGGVRVAERAGRPVGFAQLHPADQVALLYVCPDAVGRGVGGALYGALEAIATAAGSRNLHTAASRLARPFFARRGFALLEREWVMRAGARLERFRMQKTLD